MKLNFDLESTPLEIKTDSRVQDHEEILLNIYGKHEQEDNSWLAIRIRSSPHYQIGDCTGREALLNVPGDTNKIWRITQLPGPHLTIHCNKVNVANLLMSNVTCASPSWMFFWKNLDVGKIEFHRRWDTASDFYRPAFPFRGMYIRIQNAADSSYSSILC